MSGIQDPLDFLRKVWAGEVDASPTQVRAASAALPFVHRRQGEGTKKDEADEKLKAAGTGKYAARSGPRLVASK